MQYPERPPHLPEKILSKPRGIKLYRQGVYGNSLRSWDTLEALHESGYTGSVMVRYQGPGGNGPCVVTSIAQLPHVRRNWNATGIKDAHIYYCETANDQRLLIQGEILNRSDMLFFCNTIKAPMRQALKPESKPFYLHGLSTRSVLKATLSPQSYNDLDLILNWWPDHVIEIGIFDYCLGKLPHRNALIWEVRQY